MMDMDKINAELLKEDYDKELTGIRDLIGHKIIDIGLIKANVEGGLTIDYADGDKIKRIVLGFTELGMWVDWHGVKGRLNYLDILSFNVQQLYNDYNDILYSDELANDNEYSISDFCEITGNDLVFHVEYLDMANLMHKFDINIDDVYKINNSNLHKLLDESNKDWNKILLLLT
jgi:hypothetical protein